MLPHFPPPPPSSAGWPLWLDTCRVEDSALADAYDRTPMPYRAGIKQCLALCQSVYGESPEDLLHATAHSGQGFWHVLRESAAPWALFAVTPAYRAPARLAAAIMPAILARVPRIALLCLGGMPHESVRAVLELAGVEDSFIVSVDQADTLLRELQAQQGRQETPAAGRLCLLHDGNALASLRLAAAALGIPCMEEAAPPRLALDAAAEVDSNALIFAHGDAGEQARTFSDAEELPACDACFAAPEHLGWLAAGLPLILGPDMEGCWLHPHLHPDFFRNRARTAGLHLPATDFFGGGGYEGAE